MTVTSTRNLQREILAHKQRMHFNTTNTDREICLAMRELGELHEALDRHHLADIGAELADVAIYLLTLAEIRDLDLGEEIDKKMAINRSRRYETGPDGTPVRVV